MEWNLDAVRSELAVPMLVRNRLVGVIDLQSTVEDAFSAQDRALLQLIASRIGSAIDNARLYRRVERQNRTQRTLARMAQEFSSILNVEALLNKIAKSIRKLINYDAFLVMQVDEEAQQLKSLFTLFFSTKGSKGTGLGLFITEKIVRQHGGTITVDSAVGRGSRFGVIVPRRRKRGER